MREDPDMKEQPGTQAGGMTILIAEDSPTQAVQLEYLLEKSGNRVTSVRNGRQALAWLERNTPALIISDILMPEMDGFELCRQIKANASLDNVPVILLTYLSDAGDVLRGLECGADNFIVKPYDEEYLLSCIQLAYRNRRAEARKPSLILDFVFAGRKYAIPSSRLQILNTLISTYGTAVQKNVQLVQAQNELTALNEHLEEMVKQRTAALTAEIAERRRVEDELKAYSAKLERSNQELQEFAFVAAHDLQEPLRKMQTFSQLVNTKYKRCLDDQGADYLLRIQNAAHRMQTLIGDLLRYSRVASNPQPYAEIDLGVVVKEVLLDLNLLVEETRARIEIGAMPTIEADATQMRQLFQNLIGNALKFRNKEKPVIKIYSSEYENGYVKIFVEDNGIGFDEKYLDRIFIPCQRLHGNQQYEGTGMGLAICRKIAEQHGGNILARSSPGIGSVFIVTLPVKQLECHFTA